MYLSPEIIPFGKLRLKAKRLLYAVDFEIYSEQNLNEVLLTAKGPLRFGPFSVKVLIQTVYERAERLIFKKHTFDAEGKFSFSFELKGDFLELKSSKTDGIQKIDPIDEPWWDPLSLLLQIRHDFKNHQLAHSYWLVTNQKFSEIVQREDSKGIFFERKGKKQFYLSNTQSDSMVIAIDKLKAEIELFEA